MCVCERVEKFQQCVLFRYSFAFLRRMSHYTSTYVWRGIACQWVSERENENEIHIVCQSYTMSLCACVYQCLLHKIIELQSDIHAHTRWARVKASLQELSDPHCQTPSSKSWSIQFSLILSPSKLFHTIIFNRNLSTNAYFENSFDFHIFFPPAAETLRCIHALEIINLDFRAKVLEEKKNTKILRILIDFYDACNSNKWKHGSR